MKLNQFIFPAPPPSYTSHQLIGEIIYIPKPQSEELPRRPIKSVKKPAPSTFIPALFMPF